ncbi:hypothetical protein P170DRAFT_474562 [Aspergillus steynii IBT 23096]|uniref:C2H2 finger domain protein n=1 Tax=Aspergillus steynii IBT 23096 TaxID=1392250 RepID=A0A2I2GDP6_9EURO|nr:uncharacterized protein P170DRAFT_474562 [Aspergillus steynii IBT 23096]PLB51015.1 hypothetical protein P170DRAFT_474562 [Aspergillus steynii IBT 23096]
MQQDYQLYPSDSDSYVTSMAQPSMMEPQSSAPSKGLYMLAPAPWPQNAVCPDQVNPLPMDMTYHPAVADFSPSAWGGNVSTISGPESPQSSNSSWANAGCYMSPPYSCDDSLLPPQEYWDSPSPSASADFDRSVAPSDVVQNYPEPEPIVGSGYAPQPVVNGFSLSLNTPDAFSNASPSPSMSPTFQEPVPSQALPVPSPTPAPNPPKTKSSHRVTKRQPAKKPSQKAGPTSAPLCTSKAKPNGKKAPEASNRLFVCSFSHYGCPSTFVSKNEWKRHVASQHVQLGFFRCDVGRCNLNNLSRDNNQVSEDGASCDEVRLVNDFNRKDLFTQHQRRMHAPWVKRNRKQPVTEDERHNFELTLDEVRARCWHEQRTAPLRSQCGFCGQEFSGPRSWNERMEHVGRHYEKSDVPLDAEAEDHALREWAVESGVVRLADGQWKLTSIVDK